MFPKKHAPCGPGRRQTTTLASDALALAVAAAVCLVAPVARAGEFAVQRRDYAFESYFEVSSEGTSLATIKRERWRQFLRAHYVLHSADGIPLCQATTRFFSMGTLLPWARSLDIADADGQPMMSLVGDVFTLERGTYHLLAADSTPVALLHIDLHRTSCLAASPQNALEVLARYYRSRVSDNGADRWDFSTSAIGPVPDVVWQLIGAFLADSWP